MGKIAFLFSGQGAQYPGGKVALRKEAARRCSVEDSSFCPVLSGTKEELSRTENTQPCVYCVDLAAAEALKASGLCRT
ncbi:MAG: hypothetical protein ACLS8R_00035 [Anaeromassilibacillus sp.]